ncbi:MAG: M24 family metallopeptidase [Bdellovibrionales bacterium]
MDQNQNIQRTGQKFKLESYLEAREVCKKIVARISKNVESGMTDKDAQVLIKSEFKKDGITRFWHPSKFRIASDTIKIFKEAPDPTIKIQPNSIYFLDVGPIINEHEADFGRTYVFEPEKNTQLGSLASASMEIFNELQEIWRTENFTGAELYSKAEEISQARGYLFNPLMAGHRLGDFPHALISRSSLSDFDEKPVDLLWVLEVLITNKEKSLGSFYEDILEA